VACCRIWSQLVQVAVELLYVDERLYLLGDWCLEGTRDPRGLAIDVLRLMIAVPPCRRCVCRVVVEELGTLLVRMVHDCVQCAVQLLREAIGGWLVGAHPVEVFWKSWDSNWRHWSVVMVCGQPKRDVRPENMPHDTVSAPTLGRGKACGQRLKRFTAVLNS